MRSKHPDWYLPPFDWSTLPQSENIEDRRDEPRWFIRRKGSAKE